MLFFLLVSFLLSVLAEARLANAALRQGHGLVAGGDCHCHGVCSFEVKQPSSQGAPGLRHRRRPLSRAVPRVDDGGCLGFRRNSDGRDASLIIDHQTSQATGVVPLKGGR